CGRDVLVITALLQPPELSSFPTRRSSDLESTMLAINASMALAEYDTDGKITKVNTHYLEMMGYNQEEVVGEHQRIFATKEEKMSEEFRQFWKDLSSGNAKNGLFKRMTKQGETIHVRSSFSPITNRSGEVVKIMEVAYAIKQLQPVG